MLQTISAIDDTKENSVDITPLRRRLNKLKREVS